jgi:hypothetical protein
MVAEQMVGRGHRPIGVERVALVRYCQVQHSARTKDTDHVPERAEWVFAMFEEMIRDHEVLRRFVDSREPLAIVHDIDVDQCLVGELRIVIPKLVNREVIDVAHARGLRNFERIVECADLDSIATELALRDLPPVLRQGLAALT